MAEDSGFPPSRSRAVWADCRARPFVDSASPVGSRLDIGSGRRFGPSPKWTGSNLASGDTAAMTLPGPSMCATMSSAGAFLATTSPDRSVTNSSTFVNGRNSERSDF